MKILITGGAGFIGSYVQSRCKELGIETAIFDHNDDIMNDVLSVNALDDFAYAARPDAIIHLAGMLGTHELWDAAEDAIDVNIKGALNVARLAAEIDAKLVSIEQPHIWFNVYEATKFAARRMLTGMALDGKLKVDFVTAHNAFGPGQAHGEGHPQKIVPTFATNAWNGKPIEVWGNGHQQVNLVYAGDVADLLIERALNPYSHSREQFNAGSDRLMSVRTVAQLVIDRVRGNADDETIKIEEKPMRLGEQEALYPLPDETYPYKFKLHEFNATVDSYRSEA